MSAIPSGRVAAACFSRAGETMSARCKDDGARMSMSDGELGATIGDRPVESESFQDGSGE